VAIGACVTFLLLRYFSPQVENVLISEAIEESSELEETTSEESDSVDPLHAEVIAEAEAAGLSGDQLENVRSNADKIAALARIMSHSIEFYGKVVDLEGNPVTNAEVTYSAFNRFFENSKAQTTISDAEGYFAINDIKGGSIYVRVAKDGYYKIKESERSFGYAVPDENPAADDPNNPAIFKLRKHGKAEALIKFGERWGRAWSIPRNGNASGFDLIQGKEVSSSDGHIIVRAWSPDQKRGPNNERMPYSWKFEITAPGGGLIERVDQFNFIAPKSGYAETLTFEMAADAERWNDLGHEQEVFAKLKDGNYARFLFRYRPSNSKRGDSFTIESYTNPNGSRNLEYDPNLAVTGQ
jgi:hypothetical protein